MLKITVCIGSSCHIKGSRQVVEQLQYLISENNLGDKVELGGTFCMGKCQQGVCVTVNDSFHSVTPENVGDFFAKEVLAKVYNICCSFRFVLARPATSRALRIL